MVVRWPGWCVADAGADKNVLGVLASARSHGAQNKPMYVPQCTQSCRSYVWMTQHVSLLAWKVPVIATLEGLKLQLQQLGKRVSYPCCCITPYNAQ